ncbi:hypothetical protein V7128_05880 [Neobacillus vireti]|uniref:hypothetical protein n=1 Tax=Neobacillus vireti TaxID=220686 RepID=UPI002FFDAE02
MNHVESWFKGLVKKETFIFVSKKLDHVELNEITTLFGRFKVKEEVREIFLPNLKITEQGKLQVLVEVYMELHELARRLRKYG